MAIALKPGMGNREDTKRVADASVADASKVAPPGQTPDTWERERSDLSGRATQDERRPKYGNHEALAGKERPTEVDPAEDDETVAPADRPGPTVKHGA